MPLLCSCMIQKCIKVCLCLNHLLWSLPYVRVTVSLPLCYHSMQQCEEAFVQLHPLFQCLDCTLITILLLLCCCSMQQCGELFGLLRVLIQWQHHVWVAVSLLLYYFMMYNGNKVLSLIYHHYCVIVYDTFLHIFMKFFYNSIVSWGFLVLHQQMLYHLIVVSRRKCRTSTYLLESFLLVFVACFMFSLMFE